MVGSTLSFLIFIYIYPLWKEGFKTRRQGIKTTFKPGPKRMSEIISQKRTKMKPTFITREHSRPHLILCGGVPVQVCEETQGISVPDQDEVPCPISQVCRGRKTFGAPWARAGHAGEGHAPEFALNT